MYLVLSGSFEFTLFCLFWTYINLVQPPQECHAFELKLFCCYISNILTHNHSHQKKIFSSEPISITRWTPLKIYELQVFLIPKVVFNDPISLESSFVDRNSYQPE